MFDVGHNLHWACWMLVTTLMGLLDVGHYIDLTRWMLMKVGKIQKKFVDVS